MAAHLWFLYIRVDASVREECRQSLELLFPTV